MASPASPKGIRSAPDGIFQEPAPLKPDEVLLQRACAKLGIRAHQRASGGDHSPLNGRAGVPLLRTVRPRVLAGSNYASSYVQIFPAMKTGRVTVLTNAMARELITDASGKVTAVSYIDKTTGAERQVRCRTVVLSRGGVRVGAAAAQLEVLAASERPGQLDGQVGKYLTDTVGFGMSAQVPALAGMPVYNTDGYGAHLYIPWWMCDRHKELNFARGYHVEVGGGGFGMPGLGFGAGTYNRTEGYGLPMKQAIREQLRRHDDQPQRPWLDDPERALLLRDRSGREGQVGHSGAALPLAVERPRDQPGPTHARELPRDPRDAGRDGEPGRARSAGAPALRARAGTAAAPGSRRAAASAPPAMGTGRRHHPRGRLRADGRRSERRACSTSSAGARRAEPLRRRRRPVRQPRRQEPDAHDHRARVADGRVPRRGNEEGQCLR